MYIIKLSNDVWIAGDKKLITSLSKIDDKSSVWYQPMSGADFFAGQIDGVIVPDELDSDEDLFLNKKIVCREDQETPLKEILTGKVLFVGKKMDSHLKNYFKLGKKFRNKKMLDMLSYR